MKITKKYLQKITKEETKKLLKELEYKNTRANHQRKGEIVKIFVENLEAREGARTDDPFLRHLYDRIDADGPPGKPEKLIVTMVPFAATSREDIAGLQEKFRSSQLMTYLKKYFDEASRLKIDGSIKEIMHNRYSSFVLENVEELTNSMAEGGDFPHDGKLSFHFVWSEKVEKDVGFLGYQNASDLGREFQRATANEGKSYIGRLKPSSYGGANLGLDHLAAMPAEEDYSPVDRYLAQRSTRMVDQLLKRINREFGKVDQRLTAMEDSIGSLSGEGDGTVEVDPSQWPDVATSDPRKGKDVQKEASMKITKKYLQELVEEETKKFLKEKSYPGSYPVDGAGQSGIPAEEGEVEEPRASHTGRRKKPPKKKKKGQEEILDSPKISLEKLTLLYCSLHALVITSQSGDHRYMRRRGGQKESVLESAKEMIGSLAIANGYADPVKSAFEKGAIWDFINGMPTDWYRFTKAEIERIVPRLKGGEVDAYKQEVATRKYTNVEAYINSGMPDSESRTNQFGIPLANMKRIISNASFALKAAGFSKFAIGGEKSMFVPSKISKSWFPRIRHPAGAPDGVAGSGMDRKRSKRPEKKEK